MHSLPGDRCIKLTYLSHTRDEMGGHCQSGSDMDSVGMEWAPALNTVHGVPSWAGEWETRPGLKVVSSAIPHLKILDPKSFKFWKDTMSGKCHASLHMMGHTQKAGALHYPMKLPVGYDIPNHLTISYANISKFHNIYKSGTLLMLCVSDMEFSTFTLCPPPWDSVFVAIE